MQQRFCECGAMIYVQYVLSDACCRAIFWNNAFGVGQILIRCPVCNQKLNIHGLR